jgi:hypothetical protein
MITGMCSIGQFDNPTILKTLERFLAPTVILIPYKVLSSFRINYPTVTSVRGTVRPEKVRNLRTLKVTTPSRAAWIV